MVSKARRAALVTILLLLLLPAAAIAQEGGGYEITAWTLDGGGGSSSGGTYGLSGTIGQPEAGPGLTGGSYRLTGGFWGGATTGRASQRIYLPIMLRGS